MKKELRRILGRWTGFLTSIFLFSALPQVWAQEPVSTGTPAPIETRWQPLGAMEYLQNDSPLSGPQLKSLLDSTGDPQIMNLLRQSESDETLGFIALGASIAGSVVCLVIPGTDIYLGTLKIAAPFLPLQIPALALGVAGSLLQNSAGAEKYTAVQRYNRKARAPGPLTWDLSPQPRGLGLALKYAL